jgi:hypothetical protein
MARPPHEDPSSVSGCTIPTSNCCCGFWPYISPASSERAEWIRDQWLMASAEGFVGSVPHGFDELVSTPYGLEVASKALQSLRVALDQAPPTLPGAIFALLGLGSPASRDLSVQGIRKAVEALVDLFEGRIKSISRDRVFVSIALPGA